MKPTRNPANRKFRNSPEDTADGLIQHRKRKVRLHITRVKKHVSPIEPDTNIFGKEKTE